MAKNYYREKAGRKGPPKGGGDYGGGGRKQPVVNSRRGVIIGGLAALGAAGGLGLGSAATLLDGEFPDFGGVGGGSNPTHHVLKLDGTDRDATSEFQARAIVQALLHANKHQYGRGEAIDIARLGQNISAPFELEASFKSPGNEKSVSGWTATPSELERTWVREAAAIEAAILNAIRPMPQPEATLLFEAVDRAVEHARRQSGPSVKINLKLGTDLLVHRPGAGISAYASERGPRFPSLGSPLMAQLPVSSLEGVSIQIVGIRRDGRKTRSGRDLGAIQRKVAPVLIDYWAGRGADVSAASLTWV